MIKNIISSVLVSLLTIVVSPIHAHSNAHLGKINFPTSGSKEAQPYFENGIMLLHSFEYGMALAEFQEAEKIDPNFAMAFWGEAMTYNHPLWGEQDIAAATRILNRYNVTAGDRIQKTLSDKEKGYMRAINTLYGSGDKKARDIAYADLMRDLYRKYPDDDEIASFYALALLGTTETERDFRIYMQAAGIAEEIYDHNPKHPGALHYTIHSYDDPIHAPLGLRAARAYAKIAPDASHALHMPSHIFMAMGMWDDVVASNKAAWESGVKQNQSGNSSQFTIDDLHALQWLGYGYLQKRDYAAAYQSTKQMEKIAVESNTPMAKWYYALMRAMYIVSTKDFNSNLKSLDLKQVELSARANNAYANALIALNRNPDTKGIQQVEAIIAELEKYMLHIKHKPDTFQNFFTAITPSGITNTKIIILELRAQIKIQQGQIQQALQLLNQAATLENNTSFGYGPPLPVQPSYELAAALLMTQNRYAESYRQYRAALQRMPNRIEAQQGLTIAEQNLQAHHLPVPESLKPYFNKLMLPDYYH